MLDDHCAGGLGFQQSERHVMLTVLPLTGMIASGTAQARVLDKLAVMPAAPVAYVSNACKV